MGKPKGRPAMSPENREKQLIDMAYSVVEKRLQEGTVTDSLLSQIFRMGSSREKLEKERLKAQNNLAQAKTKAIESTEQITALYEEAMKMLRTYSGQSEEDVVDEL